MVKNFAQGWVAGLVLGVAALLFYSINLERLPDGDEFYHILAAKGLLATGEPSIGENGRYWRGYPTTWLVAQSFSLFGPSLTAARLPSILFTTALVVSFFVFLRREAGPAAAWIGAGLLALSPFVLAVAQFARFYSLQGLVFFIAAWLVYHQVGRPWSLPRHVLAALPAVLLLAFATYLQPTTLLGIAGLGLWAVGAVLLPWLVRPDVPARLKLSVLAGLLLVGIVGGMAAWALGLVDALWARYRATMLFNELQGENFLFYHLWYMLYYPTLWTLSGVIAVLALIDRPRLAGFAITIFVVGFLLNSFAAAKSLRYIFYAQPFLFVLWGVSLASMLRAGHGFIGRWHDRLTPAFGHIAGRMARPVAGLFLGLALLSVVIVNPAWLRSVTMLADIAIPPQPPRENWEIAAPVLEPWFERAEVVVTTEELGPLYYFGRADILLSASKFVELPADTQRPFAPDFRSDVPVIPDAASLERVMDCYASGLFITKAKWWGEDTFAPEGTMRDVDVEQLIEARAKPLDLPEDTHLLAFTWEHPEPFERPADCAALPTAAGSG